MGERLGWRTSHTLACLCSFCWNLGYMLINAIRRRSILCIEHRNSANKLPVEYSRISGYPKSSMCTCLCALHQRLGISICSRALTAFCIVSNLRATSRVPSHIGIDSGEGRFMRVKCEFASAEYRISIGLIEVDWIALTHGVGKNQRLAYYGMEGCRSVGRG